MALSSRSSANVLILTARSYEGARLSISDQPMVRVVVAARSNRVSARLPLIVSGYLIGYSLSGDGRRPPCHQTLLAVSVF